MYCKPTDYWAVCAANVKKAIRDTNDPVVALNAATEWSARYRGLYAANPSAQWPLSDQEWLEKAADKLWDELVGQYLDPADLALAMAMAKYFPKLAAMLEWIGAPRRIFFFGLLAPSPIANDFTAAGPDNEEINALLRAKLPPLPSATLTERYAPYFDRCYEEVKGTRPLP